MVNIFVTDFGEVYLSDDLPADWCKKPDRRTRRGKEAAAQMDKLEIGIKALAELAYELELDGPVDLFKNDD